MEQYPTLPRLDVKKSCIFWSPFSLSEKDVFVRSGVPEPCFYNSILYGVEEDYSRIDEKDLQEKISKLKDYDPFSDMKYQFLDNITDLYSKKTPANKRLRNRLQKMSEKSTELLDIFTSIIPIDKLKDVIKKDEVEDINHLQNTLENSILSFIHQVPEVKVLSQEKINNLETHCKTVIRLLSEDAQKECDMTDNTLCRKIKANIYLVDSTTRKLICYLEYKENTKCVILLRLNSKESNSHIHYEIIGRLHPDNRIQRIFNTTDNFLPKFEDLRK